MMMAMEKVMEKMRLNLAKQVDRQLYLSVVSDEEKIRALEQFKREDMLEVLEE